MLEYNSFYNINVINLNKVSNEKHTNLIKKITKSRNKMLNRTRNVTICGIKYAAYFQFLSKRNVI